MDIIKENLKENFNKNIKELEEIEKRLKKAIEEETKTKKEIEKNTDLFLNKEIEKDVFSQNEAAKRIEKKKKEAKRQILEIQKGLILNNLYNLINFDFKKNIYENIFYKYTLKNIGDKTKEKIYTEIQEYFKNNYNIDTHFYFLRDYNYNNELYNINFVIALIDKKKEYNNRILEYNTCLYIDGNTQYYFEKTDLIKTKYNDLHAHFIYNYDENFVYNVVDDTEKEAKKIYTTSKKLNEKIDKLLKEFEEIKKENNELFRNKLYNFNNLYINKYLK